MTFLKNIIGRGQPDLNGQVTRYVSAEVEETQDGDVRRLRATAQLTATGYGGLHAQRFAASSAYKYAADNDVRELHLVGFTVADESDLWTARGNYVISQQAPPNTTTLVVAEALQLCQERGIPTT